MTPEQILDFLERRGPEAEEMAAHEVLGISDQQLWDLRDQADRRSSLEGSPGVAFGAVQDYPGRRVIGIDGGFENFNYGVASKLIRLIARAVPDNSATAVIFTSDPDNVLFRQFPSSVTLLLINPTVRRVNSAPGPEWEEIPGGWRHGNRIVPARKLFVSGASNWKLTAAKPQQLVEELNELFAPGWPAEEDQAGRQAQAQLAEIERIEEFLYDYYRFQERRTESLSELEDEVGSSSERIEDLQDRISRLEANLSEARQELVDSRSRAVEAQQELVDLRRNFSIDGQVEIEIRKRYLAEVEALEDLDLVTKAELSELFSQHVALTVETELTEPSSGQPVTFTVDSSGVRITPDLGLDLTPRLLAIAEKFSRGEFQDLVQIVVQNLRAATQKTAA